MARSLYPGQQVLDPKKSIADKVDMIRRGKWYIVVVFVLVMGGVVAYTETITPTYETYSLLMIDTRQSIDGNGDGTYDLSNETALNSRKLPNQALILGQSLLIAERTAERLLELKKVPDTGEDLSVLGGTPREIAERLQNNYVTVAPASEMEDADGIKVTASGPTAGEVALIANLYAEEYVSLAQEASQRDVVSAREYLEQQVNLKRDELYALETEIEQYNTIEGTISADKDAGLITQQIAQLERDLDQARIDQSMREASVASLERELTNLEPKMVDRVASGAGPEILQAQKEITDLEAWLNLVYQKNPEMRERPEDNPSLRIKIDRLESLRARVRELSTQYVGEVYASGGVNPSGEQQGVSYISELRQNLATERVALSGAKAKVEAVEQRLAEYRRRLGSIPLQTSQLDKLKREKESIEKQYLDMTAKLQQTRLKEESTRSFAQIIRPATVPDDPTKPRKAVNLSLGAILGLLLGFGSAFARHRLDTRIYSADDIRRGDYPLLGVVPDMSMTLQRELGRGGMIGSNAGIVNAALVSYLSPLSPEAESYRRLLAGLQFKGIRQDIKSILVTSAEMGAGKTVTALNMAVTAAQSGRKTLIIDADMHRPSLHMNLGFSQDPRRTRMLYEGRVPVRLEELKTGINNLYALSLRDLIAIPGELLASHEMRSLIVRLRSVFDLIVFDSPPVLGASDASILSAQADATIIVAAAGQTQVEEIDAAVNELRGMG
ncbi:MAG: AAA family ATPase, partial [Rhodothermales bacterium]